MVAGGGGAGAGIGGNGGQGGDSNGITFPRSAVDARAGENCGNIDICGTVSVTAYGGAGGSGGVYSKDSHNSGTGGGGYPAAGVGGGGAGGGAGDHMNGGGGYSPGISELTAGSTGYLSDPIQHVNGNYSTQPQAVFSLQCSGGAYFSAHKYDNNEYASNPKRGIGLGGEIGGQGGSQIYRDNYTDANYGTGSISFAGASATNGTAGSDGGIAGKGGNIYISQTAHLYAYNGNECTLPKDNGNYYNKPLEIFAQNGVLREVYKLNTAWGIRENYSYEYFSRLFGSTLGGDVFSTVLSNKDGTAKNVLVRKRVENTSLRSGYINPSNNSVYGVGSGAGYIELSNGIYRVCATDDNGNLIK